MTTLKNAQIEASIRLQALTQPEIYAYVSSLKQDYAQYDLSLGAGRKIIDEAMKAGALTDILYESREQ